MTTRSMNLRDAQQAFRGAGERRLLAGLRDRVAAIVKAMEYAQMVRALDSLPDHVLTEIGLRRRDIPDKAYRLIYGGG